MATKGPSRGAQTHRRGADVSGTTAKACVIRRGEPSLSPDYFIGGYNEGLAIRIPVLDIVEVAQAAVKVAHEQLAQSQDRFSAGVAGNLEVVQAQQAVAVADENYISSLYALNLAEASLARAMGTAEKMIKSFFGGK